MYDIVKCFEGQISKLNLKDFSYVARAGGTEVSDAESRAREH